MLHADKTVKQIYILLEGYQQWMYATSEWGKDEQPRQDHIMRQEEASIPGTSTGSLGYTWHMENRVTTSLCWPVK